MCKENSKCENVKCNLKRNRDKLNKDIESGKSRICDMIGLILSGKTPNLTSEGQLYKHFDYED